MIICRRMAIVVVAILTLLAAESQAQEPRGFVTLKGGLTAEDSEDGLNGTVAAIGVSGAIALTANWRGEVELWVPRYLEDANGDPKHRDIVLGFSAIRMFRAGRTRPFFIAGFALTRTQDWFTVCTADRVLQPSGETVRAIVGCDEAGIIDRVRDRNDGRDGFLQAGGGIEIPVTDRARIVADVRFSIAPTALLVRPGIGLSIGF